MNFIYALIEIKKRNVLDKCIKFMSKNVIYFIWNDDFTLFLKVDSKIRPL